MPPLPPCFPSSPQIIKQVMLNTIGLGRDAWFWSHVFDQGTLFMLTCPE